MMGGRRPEVSAGLHFGASKMEASSQDVFRLVGATVGVKRSLRRHSQDPSPPSLLPSSLSACEEERTTELIS